MQLAKYVAIKFSLFIDVPNQRSSHSKPVPRCGGIVLVLVFIVSMLLFFGWERAFMLPFLLGGLVIAIVGLLDDLTNLKGRSKIFGMVLSTLLPITFGLKLNYLGLVGNNVYLLYILTFLWIYGMINAFNFMDGVDGLVPGVSAIFSFFLFSFSLVVGNGLGIVAGLFLLAVCVGVLLFNYNPAEIFLGDIGSMFLGYTFATLTIAITNQTLNQIPIFVFVLLFTPILFDSFVTFTRRGIEGKNVIEAHREHYYQRLIIAGFSHRAVSIIYYLLCLIFGLSASFFIKAPTYGKIAIISLDLLIIVLFALSVRILEKQQLKKNA